MINDKRMHQRDTLDIDIEVNDGKPYRGGRLFDLSAGGAAITYIDEVKATSKRLKVGQLILLIFGNNTKFPAKVVRIFEGGYATKFDFSLDCATL